MRLKPRSDRAKSSEEVISEIAVPEALAELIGEVVVEAAVDRGLRLLCAFRRRALTGERVLKGRSPFADRQGEGLGREGHPMKCRVCREPAIIDVSAQSIFLKGQGDPDERYGSIADDTDNTLDLYGLDVDTEGLLLLTNDGDLANRLMRQLIGIDHAPPYNLVVDGKPAGGLGGIEELCGKVHESPHRWLFASLIEAAAGTALG